MLVVTGSVSIQLWTDNRLARLGGFILYYFVETGWLYGCSGFSPRQKHTSPHWPSKDVLYHLIGWTDLPKIRMELVDKLSTK